MPVSDDFLIQIKEVEHGFKHIIEAGDTILSDQTVNYFELASEFLEDDSYQIRMLATYLLGRLSTDNSNALKMLETKVADDNNWRVQEMLAKAFDYYCKSIGYEKSLPVIEKWLHNKNPNVNRAVVEGLRIWTSRPYFKENPEKAIELISRQKCEESEYLRKSIGNALRDIRKKYKSQIDAEVSKWDLTDKKLKYIQKMIEK